MSGNGSSPSTSGPSPRRASSDSPLKMCSIVSKLRLMPNTRSLCAGLLLALATACGSRGAERTLLATRVPVARLDSVLKAADSVRLPLAAARRSEEHTSELQSHVNLVCRLLLEKKKKKTRQARDGLQRKGRDRP